jgi:hypothetical protein
VALPVILVNSATGSDTAASGAGPTPALTGTLPVGRSPTVSFVDIGAAQREESGGGSILHGITVV